MTTKPSFTRATTITSCIVVVALLLHSAAFYILTTRIESAIPAFVSASLEQGWRLEFAPPARAGWPWAPTVRLSQVVATRSFGNTVLRWTGEQVDLTLVFQQLGTLRVEPTGAQRLEIPPYPPIQFRAGLAVLRVPLSDPPPARLDARDLIVSRAGMDVQVRLAAAEIAAATLDLTAEGVQVRPALPAPFDGSIAGSMRVGANIPPWGSAAISAASWQAAGGRIELPAFEMRWGPLQMSGNGSGRLDGELQPEGRATVRVSGAPEMLDALARGGVIAQGPASAARAVLSLLQLAAHGEPVTLPVALTDRTLSVAQFPLLRLPMLNWNAP